MKIQMNIFKGAVVIAIVCFCSFALALADAGVFN